MVAADGNEGHSGV